MGIAIIDYIKVFIAAGKEKKRLAQGEQINSSLPPAVAQRVKQLQERVQNGNIVAMYQLGIMYLDAKDVGYDPEKGVRYLDMAAKRNDFDANYALAMYYRGNWSYEHNDPKKSWEYYNAASRCKTDDPGYMKSVQQALRNDFGTEQTRKGLQVWFKVEIPIK